MCHLHGWKRAVRDALDIEQTEKEGFRVSEHTGRLEDPIRQNARAACTQHGRVAPNCGPDCNNNRCTHDV
jgi:hypothetical protein